MPLCSNQYSFLNCWISEAQQCELKAKPAPVKVHILNVITGRAATVVCYRVADGEYSVSLQI